MLVSSVKTALVIMTKRMTIGSGAPMVKRRKVAMVLDKSDAYALSEIKRRQNESMLFTLNPSAIAKPAPCSINTPQGNVFDR